jgi:predicted phage tail protein
MSLRKKILLINLKIHSAYNKFFDEKTYTFEAYVATDIILYLKGIHPKFAKYMTQILSGESEEAFSLLDSNLKEISEDMLEVKKFKDGDTIHLVPNISGGGGKRFRNMLLFMALVVAAPYAIAALQTSAAVASASASMAGTTAVTTGGATVVAGTAKAGITAASVMKTIGLNLAISAITSMMVKSPAARSSKQTDSTVRENGMFGGLTNSSTSGTPIALIYGYNRVGGQFLSGYISSTSHGSGDPIQVGNQFGSG